MAKYPVVTIIGKPNVGKSTLLNRLTRKRESIVHHQPGVTRDRLYFFCEWKGRNFFLVDTGGIYISDSEIVKKINKQAEIAVAEAELVIFVIDFKEPLSSLDFEIAKMLRKSGKNILLVANKVDNISLFQPDPEFYKLDLGEPFPVSALHGLNIGDLLDLIVSRISFKRETGEKAKKANHFKLAIVGRPNVGKSSVLNSILGSERALVSEVPGTTRDKIDTVISFNSYTITLIDTAGLKKRKRTLNELDFYSMTRTLKALGEADIALLVLATDLGVTFQDQKIAQLALERGCALVAVFNKWDLVKDREQEGAFFIQFADRFRFLPQIPTLKVSALKGKNTRKILPLSVKAFLKYSTRIPTAKLNKFLNEVLVRIPSTAQGKLKIFYLSQVDCSPPHFVFFVNRPEFAKENIRSFIENQIREHFDFGATPLILSFRRRK